MLCYRLRTSRRRSVSPLIAAWAFVACACVLSLRRRLRQSSDFSKSLDLRSRLTSLGQTRASHAVRWIAAIGFLASPAIAQDHVNRPVKKQWRVASSQHAPPSIPDPASVPESEAIIDSGLRQANHQFVEDQSVIYPSELPITRSIHGDLSFVDGACDAGCSDCVDSTDFTNDFDRNCGNWLSVDYLHYTTTGGDLPPLFRSSPDGALPNATGVLGQPGSTLFGGGSNDFTESGIRIGGGWWFDDCHTRGVEIFYSGLPEARQSVRFGSDAFPRLGRPIIDTGAGIEAAMLIAHPSFLTGQVTVDQSSAFHHVEALRRDMQFQNSCRRIDSLIGLRYASLEDSLLISQSSTYTEPQGQIISGTTRDLFDRFEASNRFQGLVLGLDYTETLGVLRLHARGTLGLGNNRTEVIIDGRTTNTVPGPGGGTETLAGGLLAQTTNMGTHTRNRFTVMPEAFLGVSARFNYGWEIKAGYQLIYWSDAAQSANQIDRRVSQFPPEPPAGIRAPTALMDSGGVLIHGLQTGISLTF
ncbi:MAG TPA: hypothetical protein DDZ51_10140 [Planctomycetaceae bacterium]|nr:hypothetical protein [Planctomycetaceae bacterium]